MMPASNPGDCAKLITGTDLYQGVTLLNFTFTGYKIVSKNNDLKQIAKYIECKEKLKCKMMFMQSKNATQLCNVATVILQNSEKTTDKTKNKCNKKTCFMICTCFIFVTRTPLARYNVAMRHNIFPVCLLPNSYS